MTALSEILKGLIGLFVEEEFLALAVLAVVGIAALLIHVIGVNPQVAGACLLIGMLLVLAAGTFRTASVGRSGKPTKAAPPL